MGAPPTKPPLVRRTLHQLGRPLLAYFDRRFEELRTSSRASGLEVITEVSRDTDTISELTLSIERLMSRVGDRLDATVDAVDRLLDVAGIDVAGVSSLIVEAPIAHAVALQLPPGSRVLVVAGPGSVLPLELASLGFRVTALAPAGLSHLHPNLDVVVDPASRWPGPDQPFAAAFCLSGRHPVGGPDDASPLATAVPLLALIRQWLSPTGQVLLSVPLELPATPDRVSGCGPTGLDELFRNWVVQHQHVFEHRHPLGWTRRPDGQDTTPITAPTPGVAVVHARLPE